MVNEKLNARLSKLARAIIDFADTGGRYSLESEVVDGVQSNTVIVLHDIALRYDEVATVVNGAPAYRLEYCGGLEAE